MKRVGRALVIALVCAGICGRGRGQDELDITWTAPAPCADEYALRKQVAALLARAHADANRLRAVASVARSPEGYTLRLAIDAGAHHAERTLVAENCRTLSEAAAWLIAVAVDPTLPGASPGEAARATPPFGPGAAAARADEPPLPQERAAAADDAAARDDASPAEVQAATPPPPADAEAEPARARAAPTRRRAWWGRAGVFGGLWSAGLPGPQASLGARAGLGLGRFALELHYEHVFARTRSLAEGAAVQLRSDELALAGCAEWGARWRYGPCVTLAGVRTAASSSGLLEAEDQQLFWAEVAGLAYLGWRAHRWLELSLEAGIGGPITPRPRFSVAELDQPTVGSRLSGFLRLGAVVRTH